jgi:hypothetical protein
MAVSTLEEPAIPAARQFVPALRLKHLRKSKLRMRVTPLRTLFQ